MMKDKEIISSKDLMQFVNNTLKLNLKKREQHALIVLWDSNQNNTISKEEFWELIKKGQRLVDVNSSNEDEAENFKTMQTRDETVIEYSGDAKEEIIRIITESEAISIEQYFQVNCGWAENDFLTFDKFHQKCGIVFKSIPPSDLRALFDEFDLMENQKIKLANLCKDLK